MTTYKQVELFGGAITAQYPAAFADVSEIRQVPDHQEVYLDQNGFSSIVVDILERVEGSRTDAEALQYHLHDIVAEDAGQTIVFAVGEAHFAKLPPNTSASTLLAISPASDKQRGRAHEPDFVAIWLVLIRLEAQKTDLVIAINIPHLLGQYEAGSVDPEKGKYGVLLEEGRSWRERLFESFEVRDWGLFVSE